MAPRAGKAGQPESLPLLEGQQPAKKSTLLTVCPFILGNEFCERLAFYGLATNLVMYITNVMGGDPATAAIQVSLFEGTCYMTPLIGAYLADSMWGRYKTILVFSSIYLVGMVMLTTSSWVPGLTPAEGYEANGWQSAALISSLAVIALGTGGIKPNVAAFGADQFNETDPQDRREKESFFNWFYLAINVGSLIACTVIVYIQDQVSWTLGFAVPAVAMACAVLLFLAGRRVYRHVVPIESPMERVVRVVGAALHNRYIKRRGVEPRAADISSLHGGNLYAAAGGANGGGGQLLLGQGGGGGGGGAGSFPDRASAGAAVVDGRRWDHNLSVPENPSMSHRWLEDAITDWQTSQGTMMHLDGMAGHYTPQQVEEVKMVLRLMPVFFTTMLYWTIYTQMGSFFVQQGNLMARDVPLRLPWAARSTVLHVPSASMSLFNTLSIILLIPVYDKILEPLIARLNGKKITLLQRIGWGMVLAVVSMLVAAGVEWHRLRVVHLCLNEHSGLMGASGMGAGGDMGLHDLSSDDPPAPPLQCSLSIFWQAPQYFIVGASEVLASIGQLEFFYDQAPDVMRSCSMALQLLSTAVGSYISGIIVWVVQVGSPLVTHTQWLPRNLNEGRLDLFFLFMALLQAASTAAFVAVAVAYTYKEVEHKRRPMPQPTLRVSGSGRQGEAAAAAGAGGAGGGRPGAGPASSTAALPVVIRATQRRGPMSQAITAARLDEDREPTEEELAMYSRSLAYVPPSPALPAPFR